jgi:hypothetical protein
MSYLNPLRLHFAGRFQAAVSTINNTRSNFDNASFDPSFQEPGDAGGFNPSGNGDYRLMGCRVTAAYGADGAPVAADDPILTHFVADSDRNVPGKLVDLDPDQQLVSQIWGLDVRICDPAGENAVRGAFEAAPFTDIWLRATARGGGDFAMGAMWQSVVTGLEWGDTTASAFLAALEAAAEDGLSIKFNVDGFSPQPSDKDYTYGRVVGTIGPALAGEPHHFVAGRHLFTKFPPGQVSNLQARPASGVNFAQAVVHEGTGKVLLDVGNALPTGAPGGDLASIGALSMSCRSQPPIALGDIPYTQPDWYVNTAGVLALPADRTLTADELTALGGAPLVIERAGAAQPAVAEDPSGAHVRADDFVVRLDPEQTADVTLYATRFGAPLPEVEVSVVLDPNGLQGDSPPEPSSAVQFDDFVKADTNGVASLKITGHDPANPRQIIDGQVYGIRPFLPEMTIHNPSDFISVLVFDAFAYEGAPTWDLLQPIFQQYANLYPVMSRFMDLSNQQSVESARELLKLAFGLPLSDPNSMPVTRDLSSAKRAAILAWLESLGPYEPPPVPGEAPPTIPTPAPTRAVAAAAGPAAAQAAGLAGVEFKGGKTEALERRNRPMSDPPPGAER